MKNLAIIPARGGSKRIPRKNIKPFMGKPIIAYSIEAALQSGIFDEVMVSTDDEEIAEVAKQYGANVPFMRSKRAADDYATTSDVIKEVLYNYEKLGKMYDSVCCIYATAPFISSVKLIEAMELINSKKFDSAFTLVQYSYPIQRSLSIKSERVMMLWPEYLNPRSQDLEVVYHDAGQFYIYDIERYCAINGSVSEGIRPLIVSDLEVQDIDNEEDWKIAELKYQLMKASR